MVLISLLSIAVPFIGRIKCVGMIGFYQQEQVPNYLMFTKSIFLSNVFRLSKYVLYVLSSNISFSLVENYLSSLVFKKLISNKEPSLLNNFGVDVPEK